MARSSVGRRRAIHRASVMERLSRRAGRRPVREVTTRSWTRWCTFVARGKATAFDGEAAAFLSADRIRIDVREWPGSRRTVVGLHKPVEGTRGAAVTEAGRNMVRAGSRSRIFLLWTLVECVLRTLPDG
jgi:hypothetical protein